MKARSRLVVLPIAVTETTEGQEVCITGRIDVRTVPDVRQALHEILDTGTGEVLLDLSSAEIGDATALGMLVESSRRARRRARRISITAMTPRTARLLRGARLERALVRRGGAPTVSPVTAEASHRHGRGRYLRPYGRAH
jgi:anti-anti-sigma factor